MHIIKRHQKFKKSVGLIGVLTYPPHPAPGSNPTREDMKIYPIKNKDIID
jgi:hypothetical protein